VYLSKPKSFKNAVDFIDYCDLDIRDAAEVEKYFPGWSQTDPKPTKSASANPECQDKLHRRVHYLSGGCGRGKTYVGRQEAIRRFRRGKKTVICQKTCDQLEKLKKNFLKDGIPCEVIDGETHPKFVTKTIRDRLESDNGSILLITHAAIWSLLENFKGKSETLVFLDEIP
jgi:hypothetical protein